jgi:hypothetical protein
VLTHLLAAICAVASNGASDAPAEASDEPEAARPRWGIELKRQNTGRAAIGR